MRQEIKDMIAELDSKHQEFIGLHNLLIYKDLRHIKRTVLEIIGDISMNQEVREMDDYPDKFMILWLLYNLFYGFEGCRE